ncbi:MAG: L-threonine 3-dehydrogenase [archaeon]
MKALRKTSVASGLELTEIDTPTIGDDEILIKTTRCSICGTDIHIYDWEVPWNTKITPPHTIGHEGCGEIVEVGKDVDNVVEGDFVSCESHLHCDNCYMCKNGKKHLCENMRGLGMGGADGTYAEYIKIPGRSVWKNDKSLDPEVATLLEPFGNAVYTVDEGHVEGKNVLVLGCGPIGIMAVGAAKAMGAEKVIGVSGRQIHLDMAKQMGADVCINRHDEDVEKRAKEETDGRGPDVVLEMSGAPAAIEQSLRVVAKTGRVVYLGLPSKPVTINWASDFVLKDLSLKGIYGRKLFDSWETTHELVGGGKIDLKPLVTHRYKLEEFEKGFEAMKTGDVGKVVFTP